MDIIMTEQLPEAEQWLSLKEASRRLNVHPTTLRRWADNGDIPIMLTPGGHRRFSSLDITQFSQNRHGLRRVSGIEQVWAERALTATPLQSSYPRKFTATSCQISR